MVMFFIRQVLWHAMLSLGVSVVLLLLVIYPFLPGSYDSLALPLSTVIQVASVFGLLLVPIGILGLKQARSTHRWIRAAMVVGIFISVVAEVVAISTMGFSLAILLAILLVVIGLRIKTWWRSLKQQKNPRLQYLFLSLVLIPLIVCVSQLFGAGFVTNWSRDRAIMNSQEFIADIEAYRARHGQYPVSLLAQWKDYDPKVVGVEKYHYAPQGESYNVFFEQPRFFFAEIGVHEWVVYNPLNEQRMYSHTAWMLQAPEDLERSQGWYAVHDATQLNWKRFLFD